MCRSATASRRGARVLTSNRTGSITAILRSLPGHCKKLRRIGVDSAYAGRLVEWVAGLFRFRLSVVLRPKESRRFVLLPRRWVVERTFSWLNHCRRLSKDYERLMPTRETWIYLAMIKLMANRLA